MLWYEPKEKTARIDWRCDTNFWNFKIINLDNDYLGLYNINKNKKDNLIKVSKDMSELCYHAFDLQLIHERMCERKDKYDK